MNVIVEIRAGTGGEEAALFAGDLYKMYSKHIEKKRWKREVLSSNPTELGGFKEIIFSVTGRHVYGQLKYESGVHRVQRVTVTETSGRIHTSAASVVVFPEGEEVEGAAMLCIQCGECLDKCPQKINITDFMEKANFIFEEGKKVVEVLE